MPDFSDVVYVGGQQPPATNDAPKPPRPDAPPPQTRAKIQRAYRERKKENGEGDATEPNG